MALLPSAKTLSVLRQSQGKFLKLYIKVSEMASESF